MPRRFFLITTLVLSLVASLASAQSDQPPTIRVGAGFSSQSTTVQAQGAHNMADSATLREQGCEGFVAAAPAVVVSYDAKERKGALVIRASGAGGLVLLVGTASNRWYCATSDPNHDRSELELPPGSGDFSVWVGTQTKSDKGQAATLTIREKHTEPLQTSCGGANARIPASVDASAWENYLCMSEDDAGDAWADCQPRSAYSDAAADGCPGAQRCCPPPARGSSSAATTQNVNHEDDIHMQDDDDGPFAGFARPPVGSVAEGAPEQLTIETTPYGKPKQPILIHWRGFPETKLPVRATTTDSGEILFTLRGEDFPLEVTDSLLIVLKPRTLRAKHDTELSRKSGVLRIEAGRSIELLAQVSRKDCALRVDGRSEIATCPNFSDFEDTSGVFHGWSPLLYRWWIAVEDEDNQRGWLHIDRERPEFSVEIRESTPP